MAPATAEEHAHVHAQVVTARRGGGFLGTVARYGLDVAIDDVRGWPTATLVVNVVGAFALGLLLERLAMRGTESSGRRSVRLLVGTGFLGSFTTYSTFAVEIERLLAAGASATALGYLVASLAGGLVACVAGVAVSSLRVGSQDDDDRARTVGGR